MVCADCRDGRHRECREVARHDDGNRESDAKAGPDAVTMTDITLRGSYWCDCQHQPRRAKVPAGT